MLILDGFSGHHKALQKYNLEEKGIKPVYLVPHSSHLTQPLDLGIFGAQKTITQGARKKHGLTYQTDHIRRILIGLEKASISDNIISAFAQDGIWREYSKSACNSLDDSLITLTASKDRARCFGNHEVPNFESWRIAI